MIEESTWLALGAGVGFALYAVFAVAFYRFLHERDPGLGWLHRRLDAAGVDDARRSRLDQGWRFAAIPAGVCLAAAVLAALSVALPQARETEDIYALAVGVVAAVRVLAYVVALFALEWSLRGLDAFARSRRSAP